MHRTPRLAVKAAGALFGGLALLSMSGCMAAFRLPGANRPLWKTRLPAGRGFKGAVIVLAEMPKAEFALLLAEKYPDCFIVAAKPGRQRKEEGFHLGDETAGAREIGLSRAAATPENYVFHEMRMTAVEEIPEPSPGAPVLRLSWAAEPDVRQRGGQSASFQNPAIAIPAVITLGSVWPPPLPVRSIAGGPYAGMIHRFTANRGEGDSRVYIANPGAERGVVCGLVWSAPMSILTWSWGSIPFFEALGSGRVNLLPDRPGIDEPETGKSPGAWADCLDKIFHDPEIAEYLASGAGDGVADRKEWFQGHYSNFGRVMERLPGEWLPPKRGGYGFRDSSDPKAPLLLWTAIGDTNALVRKRGG